MMVEMVLESSQDFSMSSGSLPQWKRELLQRRAARPRAAPPSPPPPAPPPPPPPDDEELRYGPGIVKRLQSRYLSLALRDAPRRRPSVLRRAASLEQLEPPPAPRPRPKPPARRPDQVKRARSVDALSRLEPSVDVPPPAPTAPAAPPHAPRAPRPPRRAAPLLRETERPPPEIVRAALRKFEPTPARRPLAPSLRPPAPRPPPLPPLAATNSVLLGRARRVGVIRPMPAPDRADPDREPEPEPDVKPPHDSKIEDRPALVIEDAPEQEAETRPERRESPPSAIVEPVPRPPPSQPPPPVPRSPPPDSPSAFVSVPIVEETCVVVPDPPRPEPRKIDFAKQESPKIEPRKIDFAKQESPKIEPRKVDFAKQESPKIEPRKVDFDKQESPRLEPKKIDFMKQDSPKQEPEPLVRLKPVPEAIKRIPEVTKVVTEVTNLVPVVELVKLKQTPEVTKPTPVVELMKLKPTPDVTKPAPVVELVKLKQTPEVSKPAPVVESVKLKPTPEVTKPVVELVKLKPTPKQVEAGWAEARARPVTNGHAAARRGRGAAGGCTSVVFNFSSRKEVPDYIENDGLILRASRRDRIKAGEPGVVELRPGGTRGSGSGSDSDSGSEVDGRVSPLRVRFVNDNVLINGRSSMPHAPDRDRQARLKLQFDDSLTRTFEYPSETSLCLDEEPASPGVPAAPCAPGVPGGEAERRQQLAEPAHLAPLASNTHIVSATLGRYTPHKTAAPTFQLGLSRAETEPPPLHCDTNGDQHPNDQHVCTEPVREEDVEACSERCTCEAAGDDGDDDACRPCGAAVPRAWSEARARATDLLF